MKHGKGLWKKSGTDENTNQFEGEYHKDMKHGQGEFRWSTGGYFKGNYKNDIKSGYGVMTWADGSVYKGTWVNGIQEGVGIMSFANGTQKAGIFKENVLSELLNSPESISAAEKICGPLPEEFKGELKTYVKVADP